MAQLKDVAQVLRSKNAGAFVLTIDVVFNTREDYERIVASKTLEPSVVAGVYRVNAADVLVIPYAEANSIKVTIPRRTASGDLSDSDVYGAQQHVPLLLLPILDD